MDGIRRRPKTGTTVPTTDSGTDGKTSSTKRSVGRVSRSKKADRGIEPINAFRWKTNPKDVYICDPTDTDMSNMVDFCHAQGLVLVSYDNTDVSDCSGQWDTIARFSFDNTEDALLFKLKFK